MIAMAIAMGIGRFAFTPILPMMLAEHRVSLPGGALLASVNYFGHLCGALLAVALHSSSGRTLTVSLVAITVATLAMSVVDNFAAWMLLRFTAGFFGAVILIFVSTTCLTALAAAHRPALACVAFAGVGLGVVIAGVVGFFSLSSHALSTTAWLSLGLIAGLGTLFSAGVFFRSGQAAPVPRPSGNGSRFSVFKGEPLKLTLCYGAFGFGYIIPATFVPVMAREIIRDPRIFSLAWPVFGTAAVVSTLCVALVRAHFTQRQIWSASHLVMAAGVVLPCIFPSFLSVLAAALCVGGTFMVTTMVGMQEARDCGGPHAGRLIAAMAAAFGVGQIVGPLLIAVLPSTHHNPTTLPLLVAAAVLVATALWLRKAHTP
jgi:predicted MFS family arabinose efflux permease